MMNSAQRSAMWPPSTVQSFTDDEPSPGTRKFAAGETYSMASAMPHSASRSWPCAKPPQIQNAPLAQSQTRMRWKLIRSASRPSGIAAIMNSVRPICMHANAMPNARPRDSNALGMEVERTRPPIISPNSMMRTGCEPATGPDRASSSSMT